MTQSSLNVERRSATTTPVPAARSHIEEVAMLVDVSKCIGCKACTSACYQWNDLREDIGNAVGNYDATATDLSDRMWSVMRFTEIETPERGVEWLMRKDACMHCADPGCLKACPSPGAIVKLANGIVDINQANCIGCGYCVSACPFNIPRLSKTDNKAYKCTMCSDRVAVGLEPSCVKTCPTGAIQFGAKTDMLAKGEKRLGYLKQRGYAQPAVYNPQGVGGTHVMYVLPHGDKPGLYNGLPANPSISPWVEMWRGATKPLMSVGLGLGVLAMFYHYVTRGPVDEDAAEEAHDSNEGGKA
jgi:formate dehydrogenase iron-sulfur subunit